MRYMKYNVCVYEYLNNEHSDILQDKVYDVLYDITYYGSIVGYICGVLLLMVWFVSCVILLVSLGVMVCL